MLLAPSSTTANTTPPRTKGEGVGEEEDVNPGNGEDVDESVDPGI